MKLKRFSFLVLSAGIAGLLTASTARAQLKVGFVDPQQILASYKPFQDAQKEYNQYEQELNRDFTTRQNELQQMKENFQRQSLLLSDKRKEEEQQAILKKQQDLQDYLKEITSENGKLAKRNQELSQPILDKVNAVVKQVAKANGYDFVFNTQALVYANPDHDLTQKVLDELQRQLEAEEKKPATSTPAGH